MLWVNRSSFAMAASKLNDGPDNNHCKFRQLSLRQKCWVGTILPAYRVKMIRNVGTHTTRHPLKRVIHLIEVSARLFWTLGNGLVISNINHCPSGQAGHLSKKKKKKIPAGLGTSLLYSDPFPTWFPFCKYVVNY